MMNTDYLLKTAKDNAQLIRESEFYKKFFYDHPYSQQDYDEYKDVYDCLHLHCIVELEHSIEQDFGFLFNATDFFN